MGRIAGIGYYVGRYIFSSYHIRYRCAGRPWPAVLYGSGRMGMQCHTAGRLQESGIGAAATQTIPGRWQLALIFFMKKIWKRSSIVFTCMLAMWVLFAQSCAKFMMSDTNARKEFGHDSIAIRLNTEIVNGRKIHYAQTGDENKPTVLFIHGSPGSWTAFKSYLKDKDLRHRFRLISIDRPGFGASNYGDAISISDQAALIGRLIGRLQNGKNFYVAGHSLGGPLTVKLAAQYPQYISGIVLLAASVDPNEEKKELWRPALKLFPFCLLLPGSFRPSNIELWAFKKDVLTMPNDLNSIRCPVIIIQGMIDPLVPPGNAFYAQKQLTHARSVQLIRLDSANHFIPWTRYAQVKEALMSLPDENKDLLK